MGTDIHAAIEYREDGRWIALQTANRYFGKWDDEPEVTARLGLDRDYDLFAILADVRNGKGFAGIVTGSGFEPISSDRGIPDDISDEARDQGLTGEHSATWVTLGDILAFDWDRSTGHTGVVNAAEFERWDRMKEWEPAPRSWSGDVTGGQVQHVSQEQMRKAVATVDHGGLTNEQTAIKLAEELPSLYTRIEWRESYSKAGEQLWLKILPKMLPLGQKYGNDNVRLVMNFDS